MDDIFLRLPNPLQQRHSCSEPPRCLYNPAFSSTSHNLLLTSSLFLELSHFLLVSIPPATSVVPFFLFPARFFVSSSRHCFIPTCFLAISLRSFSLRPLAFSHAGNSNSCRNCVFPQDSYSSWLPCLHLHLQSCLEVSSYLI
jgi:hypothetical protein